MPYKDMEAGYEAKHKSIRKSLGKADHCELNPMHRNTRFEWANIDHKYSRDPKDYIQLCSSCHKLYDLGKLKIDGLTLSDRGGTYGGNYLGSRGKKKYKGRTEIQKARRRFNNLEFKRR